MYSVYGVYTVHYNVMYSVYRVYTVRYNVMYSVYGVYTVHYNIMYSVYRVYTVHYTAELLVRHDDILRCLHNVYMVRTALLASLLLFCSTSILSINIVCRNVEI